MKLIDVINARRTLEGLANKEISVRLSYWMNKFLSLTEDDEIFYQDKVKEIVDKYDATVLEQGVEVKSEYLPKFNQEIKELQDTEVQEIDIKFSLKDLSNDLKLSMKQLYPLMPYIKDEE